MARGNFQKAGNQRQKKVSADKIVKYVIKGRGRGNRKVTTSFKTKKVFFLRAKNQFKLLSLCTTEARQFKQVSIETSFF